METTIRAYPCSITLKSCEAAISERSASLKENWVKWTSTLKGSRPEGPAVSDLSISAPLGAEFQQRRRYRRRDLPLAAPFVQTKANRDCQSTPSHQKVAQSDKQHDRSSPILRQTLPTQRALIMRRITNRWDISKFLLVPWAFFEGFYIIPPRKETAPFSSPPAVRHFQYAQGPRPKIPRCTSVEPALPRCHVRQSKIGPPL